jgi:hypothetical protein
MENGSVLAIFLFFYVKTQIRFPLTRIHYKNKRIRLKPRRIRHSEFAGVFASKSEDTNSDSLDTDPELLVDASESSGTRIRPS